MCDWIRLFSSENISIPSHHLLFKNFTCRIASSVGRTPSATHTIHDIHAFSSNFIARNFCNATNRCGPCVDSILRVSERPAFFLTFGGGRIRKLIHKNKAAVSCTYVFLPSSNSNDEKTLNILVATLCASLFGCAVS